MEFYCVHGGAGIVRRMVNAIKQKCQEGLVDGGKNMETLFQIEPVSFSGDCGRLFVTAVSRYAEFTTEKLSAFQ